LRCLNETRATRPFNSKESEDIGQSASACAIEPWLLKQTMHFFGSGLALMLTTVD
jgi:hypothetical protein